MTIHAYAEIAATLPGLPSRPHGPCGDFRARHPAHAARGHLVTTPSRCVRLLPRAGHPRPGGPLAPVPRQPPAPTWLGSRYNIRCEERCKRRLSISQAKVGGYSTATHWHSRRREGCRARSLLPFDTADFALGPQRGVKTSRPPTSRSRSKSISLPVVADRFSSISRVRRASRVHL